MKTKLKRTQICLTEKQYEAIALEIDQTGISMSELIRRLIDQWMNRIK